MANNIPPSLKWLIDKRARLAGDIAKTKKALSRVEHLVIKLRSLEDALEAIDNSLKLHEIQINIEYIKPINTQVYRMKFPSGFIRNYVLEYLINSIGGAPVPKPQIVESLRSKHLAFDVKPLPYGQASRAISMALAYHHREGRVIRHHPISTRSEGTWSLSEAMIAVHSQKQV